MGFALTLALTVTCASVPVGSAGATVARADRSSGNVHGRTSIALGSRSIQISIGSAVTVDTPPTLMNQQHQPNQPISVIPSVGGPVISSNLSPASYLEQSTTSQGPWLQFWPTGVSSLVVGTSPYPGPTGMVSAAAPLIPSDQSWDNGGAWLSSVFRINTGTLVGFFHAEHHYGCSETVVRCARATGPDGKGDFWASGGVAYSNDNGVSWTPANQILTAHESQPTTPTLGGANFQVAVWDFQKHRWTAFYACQQGVSCAAVSTDIAGRSGTWFKYRNGTFDRPGLGGRDSPLPGLSKTKGILYSVSYNSKIHAWVGLGRLFKTQGVFVSLSSDLIHWSAPKLLFQSDEPARYPFLAGGDGTQVVDSPGRLYYVTGVGSAVLNARTVSFASRSR